jgi:hypothetical protein
MIPPEKGVDPFAKLKARQDKQRKEEAPASVAEPEPDERTDAATGKTGMVSSEAPPEPGVSVDSETEEAESDEVRRDPNAESIKNEVIQAAGGWGYSHQTEKSVNQGTGRVDIVLTLGSVVVACEISATTSARHEVGNLSKCLQAGFERIVYVCDATHRRRRTEEHLKKVCSAGDLRRIEFLTKRQFIARLGEIAERVKATESPQASGVGKTILQEPNELSPSERQSVAHDAWAEIQRNMERDRKKRSGGE